MGLAVKIEARDVSKRYPLDGGRHVLALHQVDLAVHEGAFVSLVGPSGCGKTSLLHVVAGLAKPSGGAVRVADLPDDERLGRIAYMFQRDLLLPWKRVVDNVALPLKLRGLRRTEARRRTLEQFERFGLAGFADAYPAALSGGMRQRAALLRTLLAAEQHRVLLLDEPLGALDSLTRLDMQQWLQDVWSASRPTVLMVTHDIDEAVFLSDRVLVMSPRPGRIVADVQVPLPRPRSPHMITAPEFTGVKKQIMQVLRSAGDAGDAPDPTRVYSEEGEAIVSDKTKA